MSSIIRGLWAGLRAGGASDRIAAGDDPRGHSRGPAGRRCGRRRRGAGPVLEPLEGRALLSQVTYHGGQLPTHAEIQPSFLGSARATNPDLAPLTNPIVVGPDVPVQDSGHGNTLVLRPGMSIRSPDQSAAQDSGYGYILVMQGDGNLVEYRSDGQVMWNTGTYGHPGAYAVMQSDGNLVVYSSTGQWLWNSYTYGHPGAFLTLLSTGEITIDAPNGTPLWSSQKMEPGEVLHPGPPNDPAACMQIDSPNGQYELIMQSDGNLVEYGPGNQVIWDSGTYGHPGAEAIMQTDGNLVVYSATGQALWDSGTYGHPGSYLVLIDTGTLAIVDEGTVIWSV
jgi:pseudomonalisin